MAARVPGAEDASQASGRGAAGNGRQGDRMQLFNLDIRVRRVAPRLVPAMRRSAALVPDRLYPPEAEPVETGSEAPPAACGWFDSSHELREGLSVREIDDLAAVLSELPLALWLQQQLGTDAQPALALA